MLIRYPGSKDRHLRFLREFIDPIASRSRSVVEPFAGTASITFDLLRRGVVDGYQINDIDESMASLWRVVRDDPQTLTRLVEGYAPAVDDFYEFREHPGETEIERAFRKIVLHQISYSGLGAAAGSPIGGRAQKSAYTVDCRWSPRRLVKGIAECHDLLSSHPGTITSGSWESAVDAAVETGSFIYLDPPYIDQGAKLYANGSMDHAALAERLRGAVGADWLISYDNAEDVASLYGDWADVVGVGVRSHLHHKNITDVIIRPTAETDRGSATHASALNERVAAHG